MTEEEDDMEHVSSVPDMHVVDSMVVMGDQIQEYFKKQKEANAKALAEAETYKQTAESVDDLGIESFLDSQFDKEAELQELRKQRKLQDEAFRSSIDISALPLLKEKNFSDRISNARGVTPPQKIMKDTKGTEKKREKPFRLNSGDLFPEIIDTSSWDSTSVRSLKKNTSDENQGSRLEEHFSKIRAAVKENTKFQNDFEYDETDTFKEEINEVFSYYENDDFDLGRFIFDKSWNSQNKGWFEAGMETRFEFVTQILNETDEAPCSMTKLLRLLLYIAQGCFKHLKGRDLEESIKKNCTLLLDCGTLEILFPFMITISKLCLLKRNSTANQRVCCERLAVDFRLALNTIYLIVIATPVNSISSTLACIDLNGNSVHMVVMNLIIQTNSHESYFYPAKKLLLLFWKILLRGFGSVSDAKKARKQKKIDLNILVCDPQKKRLKKSETELFKQHLINKHYAHAISQKNDNDSLNHDNFPIALKEALSMCDDRGYTPLSEYQLDMELAAPHQHPKEFSDILDTLDGPKSAIFSVKKKPAKVQSGFIPEDADEMKEYLQDMTNETDAYRFYTRQRRKRLRTYEPVDKRSETVHNTIETFYKNSHSKFNSLFSVLRNYLISSHDLRSENVGVYKADLDIDSNDVIETKRHKEIVSKATISIIHLLLVHFKSNHILQFEDACLELWQLKMHLKIFSLLKNAPSDVKTITSTPGKEFFKYVSTERIVESKKPEQMLLGWRNTYSTITCLKVILLLLKKKRHRIMESVFSCNSPNTLKHLVVIRCDPLKNMCFPILKLQYPYFNASKTPAKSPFTNTLTKTATWVFNNKSAKIYDTWSESSIQLINPEDIEKAEIKKYITILSATADEELISILERFQQYHYSEVSIPSPTSVTVVPDLSFDQIDQFMFT